MKNILSVLAICLSSWAFSQEIVGNWSVSSLPFNKAEKEYLLYKVNPNEPHNYGFFLQFNKNNTFTASYGAPCGNDCFPFSKGTYKLVGKDQIELITSEIGQWGQCENYNKKGKWNLGIYKIVKTKEGFNLVK